MVGKRKKCRLCGEREREEMEMVTVQRSKRTGEGGEEKKWRKENGWVYD